MDLAALADHSVKMKEGKKRDKYLDLAEGLKKIWNMSVTVIPIVVDAIVTVPYFLEKKTGGIEN